MSIHDYRFWVALIAMAFITWATRALPFLWGHQHLKKFSEPNTPLTVLGPSLLSAICVTVILPNLIRNVDYAVLLPYVLGLIATALTARIIKNPGGAALIGVTVYGLLLFVSQRYG